MPKRGRGAGESLTGGTGDVNPQYFNMTSSAAITTSFATTTVPTPINKFPEGSGRVVIMELLKAFIYFNGPPVAITAGDVLSERVYVTTKNFATTEPTNAADGTIILNAKLEYDSTAATASTGFINLQPITMDLTDGAGHGMLVATDNLYLGIIATTAARPYNLTVTAKIIYRFKKVSLQEYIGIVQSQQNS